MFCDSTRIAIPTDDETSNQHEESAPDEEISVSPSMELPAVILGERGDDQQPKTRVLPGRIPLRKVLRPAYAVGGLAGAAATLFSLFTGEWHPLMVAGGWALLLCWYWVYGIGYRYRRWLMKYFSLLMATINAMTLVLVTIARAGTMHVPDNGELVARGGSPLLVIALLTFISLVVVIVHAVYLGRGYRQKEVDSNNELDR